MGQSDFENANEDQIMQEDDQCGTELDFPEKEMQEWDEESKAIPKMKQSLEVQDLQGATDPYVSGRCSDTGKLICLICMSVRESWYKSLTENNWVLD